MELNEMNRFQRSPFKVTWISFLNNSIVIHSFNQTNEVELDLDLDSESAFAFELADLKQ